VSDTIDVEQELAALRARVRGAQPANTAIGLTPLQKAIAYINAHWALSARVPTPPNPPLRQRPIYFATRVARRAMVVLLNTIVEQQSAFNAQTARALSELVKENDQLHARIQELEDRLQPK